METDFEQAYIDKSKDLKAIAGLKKWREDGKTFYRALVKVAPKGRYILLDTKEHLLPFSNPQMLVDILSEL